MDNLVLVIGESGHGKSTSIRTLDPKSTFLINVANKLLPFPNSYNLYKPFNRETNEGNLYSSADAYKICNLLKYLTKLEHIKNIVIDDFQYVMAYEFIKRAKERGYDKFTEIGQNAFNIVEAAKNMREDQLTFILSHSEDINTEGYRKTKAKTIGRMLDEKITFDGLFSIVLLATIEKEEDKLEYYFVTCSDGYNTAKSPIGMFDYKIPNDLNFVANRIREYHNTNN